MNTIKIFLGTDGSVFNWHQDTNIYQGAYQNTLLNIYVPLSILSVSRAGETVAVKSAMRYTDRAGKQKISESRYFSYVKDLTYNGVGYALYQRLMPKEYTLYSGACNMIINVVSMVGELITTILTTQVCTLTISPSAYADKEQTLTPTELEKMEGELNDLSSEVQKKQDSEPTDSNGNPALETASHNVTNAINEINTDYKILNERVDNIEQNYSTGEDYIGSLKQENEPTNEELTAYVFATTGEQVKNGDVIYWYQTNTDGATIKTVKYIYTKNNWLADELPPVQKATNVNYGVVKGSQSNDSNDIRAYYSAGELNDITIKDKGAETYHSLKNTSDDVIGLKDGAVVSKKAEQDQYGFNIFDTYASKQYVTDNTLPMIFNKQLDLTLGDNDTFFANFGNVTTDIWAEELNNTSRTFNINSVGETILLNAAYTLLDKEKFTIYSDNNFKCEFPFQNALEGQYILRIYAIDSSEWLIGVDSKYVNANTSSITFEGAFNRLGNQSLNTRMTLKPNNKIKTVLSYVSESSINRTMTLYADTIRVSMGQLEIASIKLASGFLGEQIFLDNWNVVSDSTTTTYTLTETNLNIQDGVSAVFKLPIADTLTDSTNIVIKLLVDGEAINIYAPNKSTKLSTLGDFKYYKDSATNGLFFTAFNDNGNWRVQGDNLATLDDKQDKISRADNLIPFPYYENSKTVNGVNISVNDDGCVTLNGTATANYNFYLCAINKPINGDVILTGCPVGGSSSTYFLECTIVKEDGTSSYLNDLGNGNKITYSNATFKSAYIFIGNGATFNNLTFKPCLNVGTAPARAYYADNAEIYNINQSLANKGNKLYKHALSGKIVVNGITYSLNYMFFVLNTKTVITHDNINTLLTNNFISMPNGSLYSGSSGILLLNKYSTTNFRAFSTNFSASYAITLADATITNDTVTEV